MKIAANTENSQAFSPVRRAVSLDLGIRAARKYGSEDAMPPAKRRRPAVTPLGRVAKRLALNKHIAALQKAINRLKRERASVTRAEFAEVVASLRQLQRNTDAIAEHARDLATQLTRMSQIQAEVDEIRRALKEAKLLNGGDGGR